jgi:hypothetical protein
MPNPTQPSRRPERRYRLTFHGDQLQVLDGLLVERTTGLQLAKVPPGRSESDFDILTITSSAAEVVGNRLVTCCSGPCRSQFPLSAMGLRTMRDGSLRNQPQCPECRGRYRKPRGR